MKRRLAILAGLAVFAAAGFSPTTSGQYFVAVSLVEGEPSTVCLVYSYK